MSKVSIKLIHIPATPLGIFDTVKLRLDRVAEQGDLNDLLSGADWKHRSGSYGPMFLNRTSGLRAICYGPMVMVEASIPRVLGLRSDDQHHVRVTDFMEAIRRMQSCLPRTTDKAMAQGQGWFASRLDLAKNLIRPEGDLLEAVRLLKFPPVKPSATLFGDAGVGFYGGSMDLVLYNTDKRPLRGKLKRDLCHQRFDRTRRGQVRCELRFKSPLALAKLVEHLEPDPDGLRVGVKFADSDPITTRCVRVDYHRMQRVLATHVDSLTAVLPDLGGHRATASVFRAYVLATHGTELPDLWPAAISGLSDRQVRNIKQQTASQILRSSGISLVDVIWDRPRISPDLHRKLVLQMGGVPAGVGLSAAGT